MWACCQLTTSPLTTIPIRAWVGIRQNAHTPQLPPGRRRSSAHSGLTIIPQFDPLVMRVDMTKKLCLNAPLSAARNIATNSQKVRLSISAFFRVLQSLQPPALCSLSTRLAQTICLTLVNMAAQNSAPTNYTIKVSGLVLHSIRTQGTPTLFLYCRPSHILSPLNQSPRGARHLRQVSRTCWMPSASARRRTLLRRPRPQRKRLPTQTRPKEMLLPPLRQRRPCRAQRRLLQDRVAPGRPLVQRRRRQPAAAPRHLRPRGPRPTRSSSNLQPPTPANKRTVHNTAHSNTYPIPRPNPNTHTPINDPFLSLIRTYIRGKRDEKIQAGER